MEDRDGPDAAEGDFEHVIAKERKRSLRYNRFFSLILVPASPTDARSILNRCTRCLRDTDTLGILPRQKMAGGLLKTPSGESANMAVGAILPETDRNGAEVARARLSDTLAVVGCFPIGLATYPDDGVDFETLIQNAAG